MKINYVIIVGILVRKLDTYLQENISGKYLAGTFPAVSILSLGLMLVPSVLVSCYFIDFIAQNSKFGVQNGFSVFKHMTFQGLNFAEAEAQYLSFFDALWLSIVPDLVAQQMLIFVKVLFWLATYINPFKYHTRPSTHRREEADDEYDVEAGNKTKSNGLVQRRVSQIRTSTPQNSNPQRHDSGTSLTFVASKRIVGIIEVVFYIYRSLLPMSIWCSYFAHGFGSHAFVFGYLVVKGGNLSVQVRAATEIIICVIYNKLEFGRLVSVEEMGALSHQCSICFEDHHQPVMLDCHHCFCEVCIYEWVDREPSCPFCRADVSSSLRTYAKLRGEINTCIPVFI